MTDFTEKFHINQQLMRDMQFAYLRSVRTGPGVLGFKPTKGAFYEKHFTNDAQALALIAANGSQADTWVSMATYSDPNASRSQDNAEGLCALWLDVDAHEDSKYETVEAVQAALQIFLSQTDLPEPSVINLTGNGVHAIWVFTQVIGRNEWQPVADKLQDLAERMLLGADPITADAARILRVPGTLNYRDSENPKLAVFEETGVGSLEFDEMASAIDQALFKFPALVKTRGKHRSAKKFDSPPTGTNKALVKAMLLTIDPDIGYCEWRDVVWAVAATGWDCSYGLARSWSSQGATWDEAAFNRVWDGFDPSRGIGFGTLAYHAKQAGYAGPMPSKSNAQQIKQSGRLVTVCAADIKPERVEWLVDQSFPLGMLAVIGGQPGLGKSQISINLAAGVTTGKGLPGTVSFKDLGSVIILANEDDAARTIRPRLDAAGADISKVHIVQGVAREGVDVDMFQLDLDIADLRERALQIGDVKLIIVDPPSAYLGSKVDSYKDSDVRRVLMPLGTLAQETGAMILLIVHLNKRTDGGAQQRFSGSTAWTAAPRVGFMVAEDPLTKQRFMLPVKNNIGDDRLGYQYHISEKLIQYDGQTFKSSYIVWDQTTIQANVAAARAQPSALPNTGYTAAPQLPMLGAFLQQAVVYEGWRNGSVFDPYTALSSHGVQVAKTFATTLSCPDLERLPVNRWRELGWKEEFWACREMAAATLTKAAEAGMRLQLSLFFSDKAADAGPRRQQRPAAWSGLSNTQLVAQVRNYARETAAYFKARGLKLDVVEIGNETDFGFCGYRLGETISVPAGVDPVNDPQWMHDNVWSLCSPLYQAGIEGIKSVFPDCATALHVAGFTYSRQDIAAHSFFSAMKSDGVTFDIADLSYPYPSAGTRLIPQPYFEQDSFLGALDKIRALGKRVQIVEFSYPASTAGIEVSQAIFGCTPAAQARFVEAIARAVAGRVEQITYWATDVFPGINGVGGLPQDVESFGLFASALEARPALNSWRRVAADRLMDWAEIKYADLFPGSAQSAVEGPYYYRYYPASDTYLGMDERSGSVLVHNGRNFNMAVIGPLANVLRMM